MSERKCPACGENLEKNESVCPICELSDLDQVFLTKEAYELWKRDVLEKHLRGIVKKEIWYRRKESDEKLIYGTLLFCKNNGRTFAVLRPKKEGNTYRINRLTRLGKFRYDYGYWKMFITSDAGEFLIQKWLVEVQDLPTVRNLLKQLLPPFKGPANVWKDLDERHDASGLRLKGCNGGEYDCTEEMAAQKMLMDQELMRSHYLKWLQNDRSFREKWFVLTAPFALLLTQELMRRHYQKWLQNRRSFREKWFVLTAPYTLLHTQNGTKAIFQTQGGESIPVNQTSIEILEILQEGAFFQDIECELEERYCAKPEQIQDAVESYLRELLELRICKSELGEECKE